jgi:hypothetical protein
MSNDKMIADEGVLIGRSHWDVPVRVKLAAYLRFSRRLDSQLRRLVVRWAHTAPPKSRGGSIERGPAGTARHPK